jgi:peptidoglycan/xylan/chitin deacetylase (PgdA/CDA1 family)
VLLYHGIYGTRDPESDSVTLAAFRQQMAYLYQNGYRTISPRQYQLWTAGQPVELPAKPVLLTVDDNQVSFLQALPVLRQYHYRVVMYPPPDSPRGATGVRPASEATTSTGPA